MKRTITIISLLATSLLAIGQQFNPFHYNHNGIVNDSKLVLDLMEKNYPGYKHQIQQVFDNNKNGALKNGQTYTINTVVHVVWKNNEENIHDSIIERQIEILNEDYGRTNPDTINLRPMFDSIAGNPNIQFNLVAIERVQTNETFALSFTGLPDNVKETANGGSDAWNTEYYLNIWVCKIESNPLFGSLFGFAYPPAGLSHWPSGTPTPDPIHEGVVIDFRTVADNNPNDMTITDPSNPSGTIAVDIKGRTATHEIGHYLGLRHTSGDPDAFSNQDGCTVDDGCNDTPNQAEQSSFDCNTNQNTCTDPSNDMPDLIENHMDYSAESCKNMFTNDQIGIMRSVLENERVGLLSDATNIEEEIVNNISVYPNPTKGQLTIAIDYDLNNETIEIINLLGEIVFQQRALSTQQIDLSNFDKGLYVIRIKSKEKTNYTSKLILK